MRELPSLKRLRNAEQKKTRKGTMQRLINLKDADSSKNKLE
jgi:hypothetical protein